MSIWPRRSFLQLPLSHLTFLASVIPILSFAYISYLPSFFAIVYTPITSKMLFNALAMSSLFVAVAVAVAAPEPAPYRIGSKSLNPAFGLAKRQAGYQPTQTYCGPGNTCAESCGADYVQCPSTDGYLHCYDPSIKDTCCSDGTGSKYCYPCLLYNADPDFLCEQTPVPRDSSAPKMPLAGRGAAPMYVSPSTIRSYHSSPNPYRDCLSLPALHHIA
jgi:hypothetical protein